MADYHPLIARAVAGLEKNSGENRRALYERARIALVAEAQGDFGHTLWSGAMQRTRTDMENYLTWEENLVK